jgi:spore coat polysaccharide biosynthesis predicted glycosyltransferase SpsG
MNSEFLFSQSRVVLFRLAGGRIPGISFGHLFRCIALAEELKEQYSTDSIFLTNRDSTLDQALARSGFRFFSLPNHCSPAVELEQITSFKSKIIVVDLPEPWTVQAKQLIRDGFRVISITDSLEFSPQTHIVVNGNIIAKNNFSSKQAGVTYFTGPKYTILGPEFDRWTTITRARTSGPIFISMGGSDPTGLTLQITKSIAESSISLPLAVSFGPGFADSGPIEESLIKYDGPTQFLYNAPSLAPHLGGALIAITAGGLTAYQAASMGIPSIVIPSITHEAPIAAKFHSLGMSRIVHPPFVTTEEQFAHELTSAITDLYCNPDTLAEMARIGKESIDGKGRQRVARIINDQRQFVDKN